MEALAEACATCREHPPRRPAVARAVRELADALAKYGGQHGQLVIVIKDQRFLVDDQSLDDQRASRELVHVLGQEGVSRLVLDAGLTRDELSELVAALSSVSAGGDGRLLLELWSLDLEDRFSYRAQDPIAPASTRQVRAAGPLARVSERLAEFLEHVAELDDDAARAGRVMRERLEQATPSRPADQGEWARRLELAADFRASPLGAARQRLASQDEADLGQAAERAANLALWARDEGGDGGPSAEQVVVYLAGLALGALDRGELEQAIATLERAADVEDLELDAIKRLVSEVLCTRAALVSAVRALESLRHQLGPDELIRAGLQFFVQLGDELVEPLCELYPYVEEEDVRRVLRRVLTTRVEARPHAIAALTAGHSEEIGREVIGILALAGPGSEARELLRGFAAEEGTSPRATWAAEALEVVTGSRRRRELSKLLLESDDRKVRLAALKQLRSDASSAAFDSIRKVAEPATLLDRDEDEIQVVLEALVSSGGVRAVKTLRDLGQLKQPRLFGRKKVDYLRAAAHAWLKRLRERPGS